MRHRKPGSLVDHPDVEISTDPLQLGHDTLVEFLALQRAATEAESESHPAPIASETLLRVLVLGILVAVALLATGALAVLYAHPA